MRRHEGLRPRQTRIVATLGQCKDGDWPPFLQRLCDAGADVFRLNLSHADADYAKERAILRWCNTPTAAEEPPRVAVVVDLQGPKARIGRLPDAGIDLVVGDPLWLAVEGAAAPVAPTGVQDGAQVPVPEPLASSMFTGLAALLCRHPGVRPLVLFGDGDIAVEILHAGPDGARGTVVAGGRLGSRKGVTVREIDLDLDPFPARDQRDLRFCLDEGVDFVAVSFVRTAADLERVRQFIRTHLPADRPEPKLIAKIETLAALENLDSVLAAADGVMVARGDLGLQLGVEEVPYVQKRLVHAARRDGKAVIVATQMLESMITAPQPTRAEATDVFNAIVDGGDAVMLSGETSIGTRPVQVVETMDRIARKAEAFAIQPGAPQRERRLPRTEEVAVHGPGGHLQRINEMFAVMAVQFAGQLRARAIVCFTRTGRTPERLSRHRPAEPILAFCPTAAVARQLLLYSGVHPVVLPDFDADKQKLAVMVTSARRILHERYGMQDGDAIVVTAGIGWPRGGTNAIQVLIEDHGAVREVDVGLGAGPAAIGATKVSR